MQSVKGVGRKFFSTVCCIGLYSVCCPKITIVSAVMIISSVVTLAKTYAIWFVAFAGTKILRASPD